MSEIENICDVIKRFLNENNECIAGPECRTKNCNCKKEKYRCKIYNEFYACYQQNIIINKCT